MPNDVELKKVCKPIFDITYERYMQLAREDLVPKSVRGKIDFIAAAKALIAYYRKLAETHGELSLSDERKAWTAIRKEREKLKLETERGNLVPVDQAKIWLGVMVGEAKLALRGFARREAPVLITMRDEKDIEQEIRKEIDKILWQLTKPLTRKEKKHGKQGRSKNKHQNSGISKGRERTGSAKEEPGKGIEPIRESS